MGFHYLGFEESATAKKWAITAIFVIGTINFLGPKHTGGIAVWLLRLYFQPRADCRRCGGTGRNAFTRAFGGGRNGRTGSCGACGGSGKRFVLGAAALHQSNGVDAAGVG